MLFVAQGIRIESVVQSKDLGTVVAADGLQRFDVGEITSSALVVGVVAGGYVVAMMAGTSNYDGIAGRHVCWSCWAIRGEGYGLGGLRCGHGVMLSKRKSGRLRPRRLTQHKTCQPQKKGWPVISPTSFPVSTHYLSMFKYAFDAN